MSNINFAQVITAADKAAAAKVSLLADLAQARWEAETGGLVLPNGLPVRTDRETRAALTEAVNALQAGLMQEPIPWKMAGGWADLSKADLEAITTAVAAHVQASFAAERSVQAQIDEAEDLTGFDVSAMFEAALKGVQTPE
ncbi:DUF4376 domain-containing protein [Pseudophaeobacter sp.]|uniref:DUF4376 domain-containing protein n=1 Tax=Pseudophaeobacter sp. TaxID=1971739 RepID=UPI0040585548